MFHTGVRSSEHGHLSKALERSAWTVEGMVPPAGEVQLTGFGRSVGGTYASLVVFICMEAPQ